MKIQVGSEKRFYDLEGSEVKKMNELQVFNFENQNVRVIEINNEPWFVAKDVAEILGFRDPYTATRTLDDDEKLLHTICVSGQNRETTLVNEPGLYSLILKSRKPEAKQFKRWVTHEVIPSIRKHGGYIATNEDDDEATIMAKALLIANKTIERKQRENEALHRQIEQDAPYTKFGKVVAISDGAINIGTFAKMLYDKHGIKLGRNKLLEWLRNNGYLICQKGAEWNLPKQEYIKRGWFKVRPAVVSRTEGDIQTGTPLITGKGQVAIANILLKEFSDKVI